MFENTLRANQSFDYPLEGGVNVVLILEDRKDTARRV
jgi:hypothetical protein